jgi:subtilisin
MTPRADETRLSDLYRSRKSAIFAALGDSQMGGIPVFKRLFIVLGVLACASSFAGKAQAAVISDQYIVVLKPRADRSAAIQYARSLGGTLLMQYKSALSGYAVELPSSALPLITADNRVRFVLTNRTATLNAQTLPTGVDRIDGELSSTRSGDGRGSVPINVAVVDTGIDLEHPDLNVVGGKNCGADADPSFDDHYGHGTHVAGTIGAKDNGEGVVGVAPGARLWAVRVGSGIGQGSTATALCGVDFVTRTRTDSDATNDIAVANMSLGFFGPKRGDDGNCGLTNHDVLHLAICNSVAAGVTWVVAAGNAASDFQNDIPATYSEVLTVTAMADFNGQPGGGAPFTCRRDVDDAFASFSSFATLAADQAHTIAAPGRCILSTAAPNSLIWGGSKAPLYGVISGTSMASPHVAGTVALCIFSGGCAGLTPAQIIQKMRSDAEVYNNANPDYGFVGDPLRPVTGKYYGYLIRAALY